MVATASIAQRWDALADAIRRHRAVLDGRPQDEQTPPVFVERGWDGPLTDLSDDELAALEIGGADVAWPARLPLDLLALRAEAAALCELPALPVHEAPPRRLRRREKPRKRAQIEVLAGLALPLAERAGRVVDVGSGHGHLAREVAERIERPVIGLERDPTITARAQALPNAAHLRFERGDALEGGLALQAGDLALGLHACGELGDALVIDAAARAGSALLVGCCLQKLRGDVRFALIADRALSPEVALPKSLLGLSNFTPREIGVEATREENIAARERRHALHRLLSDAGPPLRFGAEMDGLNRRAAHGSLDAMVAHAFAMRGLASPGRAAIDEAARWAKAHHDRLRRLSLPRVLLGRVLEVFVLHDRALHLERAGFDVRVGVAFPKEVSARNLTLIAERR